MKRIVSIIFWFAILILSSFNFYIVFPTKSYINWNGVMAAKVCGTVGIMFLLFLTYKKIERLFLKKGIIQTPIKTIYDFVPAVLFLLFATGGQYVGDQLNDGIARNSDIKFDWLFSWGFTNEKSFIVIILALVMLLLYKCYRLINEIEKNDQ